VLKSAVKCQPTGVIVTGGAEIVTVKCVYH